MTEREFEAKRWPRPEPDPERVVGLTCLVLAIFFVVVLA